jgi:hypothetical protein
MLKYMHMHDMHFVQTMFSDCTYVQYLCTTSRALARLWSCDYGTNVLGTAGLYCFTPRCGLARWAYVCIHTARTVDYDLRQHSSCFRNGAMRQRYRKKFAQCARDMKAATSVRVINHSICGIISNGTFWDTVYITEAIPMGKKNVQ